ncbi:hypothetical protein NLX86_12350 [Streptomyces sp. A3M-1-3]|uniref:hypothetical protein n=1 Tax=Streptomyces sp. A3M-1-3 TaxID=2962044 RepID=UPI0020B738E1|nr:hypothetical protein [Streptomyces sp. A3M-1-3]MCP3818871.1 hypothetical protein [Streptomyces sp. A3M-1-3]
MRKLRAAAGRRVLPVVLFLGGLLALGFLCGGPAHAAELPVAPVAEVRDRMREVVPRELRMAADSIGALTRPVADTVHQVVRPVGEVAEEVTGALPASLPDPLPVPLPPLGDPEGDRTPQAPENGQTLPASDRPSPDEAPAPPHQAGSDQAVPVPFSSYRPAAWGQVPPDSRTDATRPAGGYGKNEQAPVHFAESVVGDVPPFAYGVAGEAQWLAGGVVSEVEPIVQGVVGDTVAPFAQGVVGEVEPFAYGVTSDVQPFAGGLVAGVTEDARPAAGNAVTGAQGMTSIAPQFAQDAFSGSYGI